MNCNLQQCNKVLIKSTNEVGFIIDFIDGYTVRVDIIEIFDVDEHSNKVNIKTRHITVPLSDIEPVAIH